MNESIVEHEDDSSGEEDLMEIYGKMLEADERMVRNNGNSEAKGKKDEAHIDRVFLSYGIGIQNYFLVY